MYERGDKRKYALQGFANMYCRGWKQGECIRKKVSMELGGPDKVPQNMMPNGLPLPGTVSSEWLEEVKRIAVEKP